MTAYSDAVFAPIDYDHVLERVAGGNETEVYRSDDGRYVVKLKAGPAGAAEALAEAQAMRAAAEVFAGCLGPDHSIDSYYLLARDSRGDVQVLVVQPFLAGARALYEIDYAALSRGERRALAAELRAIIGCSLALYRRAGVMPDLYGRTSHSSAERRRLNGPLMLPWRLWGFLVRRTLLHSHNLLRTPAGQVALVDYDDVRRGPLYRGAYYLARVLLFLRDHAAIWWVLR